MKVFIVISTTLLLTISNFALAKDELGETSKDIVDAPTPVLPQQEAINIYGEVQTESEENNKQIEETETALAKAKKSRQKLGEDAPRRDIAGQKEIDKEWTEELTELHKMEE